MKAAVWEITMACNMRCKHCGSQCETALEGELNTNEALDLCRQLGALKFNVVTLSGGEPTVRKDWKLIANELKKSGVQPTMITNGWLIDEKLATEISDSGIEIVAISIDGMKEHHDYMRRDGSFEKSTVSMKHLRNANVPISVITTINSHNINELEEMREYFINQGVRFWQLQIGVPMGNFKEHDELMIEPEDMDKIIDFAHKYINDDRITLDLADTIGYYNLKEMEVKGKRYKIDNYCWDGCGMGKTGLGILHNGDVVGCTSMRENKCIAGNIRERSLKDIWEDKNSFSEFKNIKREDLTGICLECGYADRCLGGCPNVRMCTEGDLYAENKYCSYRNAIVKEKNRVKEMKDVENIKKEGFKAVENGMYQMGDILLSRALEIEPENIKVISSLGFTNYKLKNFKKAKNLNQELLKLDSKNPFSYSAMGLTLYEAGEKEEGIDMLYKSLDFCTKIYLESYYDLAITLKRENRDEEAKEIYERACQINENFSKHYKNIF